MSIKWLERSGEIIKLSWSSDSKSSRNRRILNSMADLTCCVENTDYGLQENEEE